tara:strand:+ start:187 stop:585 length:399 start_codon:yes stop_codon:yes gene_type:complete
MSFILLLIIGIPLFLLLFNTEYYENKHNILIAFTITVITVPYFRLLYNKFNSFTNFNFKHGVYINVLEKLVCGILFYIIILNNYNINNILNYIFVENEIKIERDNENILENVNYTDLNNHILLNNFKNLFDK